MSIGGGRLPGQTRGPVPQRIAPTGPTGPVPTGGLLPKDGMRARRFARSRTIMALILREMSTRYGRSPGGYIWAILDPLGTTLLLALAFSLLMSSPPLGVSFTLFKATGMMPFNAYSNIWTSTSHAISFSKPLLRYPGVGWLDALLARLILNTLTSAVVMLLIFTGILMFEETQSVLDLPVIFLAFTLAVSFGFAIGCVNIYFFMRFPAWEHTWNILNRPMFLASGILFVYESMPKLAQDLLWWNPLVHIIGLMRTGFYPMYYAPWVSVPYVMACTVVPLVIGLMMMRRHHIDLLNI